MESLPDLYRDAVKVTRQLGVNYLWIDSLCIIQDSDDDWSKEAASMGDIFQFSYLTLYALDSQDCHQGILVRRSLSAVNGANLLYQRSADTPLQQLRQDVFRSSSLCQRAWALQERLLSPRILYYSTIEMFWECLECTAREGSTRITRYNPGRPYQYHGYECTSVKIPLILPLGTNPSLPNSPPSDWHIIPSTGNTPSPEASIFFSGVQP